MPRTVVITGVSRGWGAAAARAFLAEDDRVVGCARDREALDTFAADAADEPGELIVQRADVRDEFDVERLMETAAREWGPIDILFANAGVYHGTPGQTPLAEDAYSAFDEHLRTNGRGVFTTVKEAVPHLAEDARVLVPSGRIAREAKPGFGSYAVSKTLAEAVARQFAVELEVPVGIVDPGQLSTELTDHAQGRDPQDVAGLITWAATEAEAEDLNGEILDLRTWKKATR